MTREAHPRSKNETTGMMQASLNDDILTHPRTVDDRHRRCVDDMRQCYATWRVPGKSPLNPRQHDAIEGVSFQRRRSAPMDYGR
jgi:hypothetical protein